MENIEENKAQNIKYQTHFTFDMIKLSIKRKKAHLRKAKVSYIAHMKNQRTLKVKIKKIINMSQANENLKNRASQYLCQIN